MSIGHDAVREEQPVRDGIGLIYVNATTAFSWRYAALRCRSLSLSLAAHSSDGRDFARYVWLNRSFVCRLFCGNAAARDGLTSRRGNGLSPHC